MISHEEFEKFKISEKPLGEFLFASPFLKLDLDIERDSDPGRKIDLFFGSNINVRILPSKKVKNRLKRTQKSTEP